APAGAGHAEALRGLSLEVHLDQDRRLVADDIAVVAGSDRHHLRRHELQRRPVRIVDVNPAAGDEADVRVHALGGGHLPLHVRGPAEARLVDDPLDAAVARAGDVDLDAADHAGVHAFHPREQRVMRTARHQWRSRIGIGSLPSAPAVIETNSGSFRIDANTASTRASIISLLLTASYFSYSKKCRWSRASALFFCPSCA